MNSSFATPKINQRYPYDIALSFAGENREYAEELAQVLKDRNIKVFYDKYEEAILWGKDLYTHLSDVYQNKARFCVMFLSKYYATKLWTNHERKAAQARAFQENKEYILPIRLDNTEIPGIPSTIGYLEWSDVNRIANAIVQKLELESSCDHPQNFSDISNNHKIRIALVGPTGVGKTSLISTLLKAYSGEISSMGNTTKEAEDYNIPESSISQMIFVDCPALQNPSNMLSYLDLIEKKQGESAVNNFFEKDNFLKYDIGILESLKNTDVVLYVADVGNRYISKIYLNELEIIQKIQPQIVAILNKAVQFQTIHGEEDTTRQISLWKETLNSLVKDIVIFDTIEDEPAKVQEIYNAIFRVLPSDRKKILETALRNFSD